MVRNSGFDYRTGVPVPPTTAPGSPQPMNLISEPPPDSVVRLEGSRQGTVFRYTSRSISAPTQTDRSSHGPGFDCYHGQAPQLEMQGRHARNQQIAPDICINETTVMCSSTALPTP